MPEGDSAPMEASVPDADGCTLCDLPVDRTLVENDAGDRFCCRGCLNVHDALSSVEGVDAEDVVDQPEDDSHPIPDHHERTFLEVDGMYCATCERFIETLARDIEGVSDARASYVTNTVRVDRDPESVSTEALQESISGLGYTAYPREDSFSKRRSDHWSFARLAAGVLVGMMVMFQYFVIIYPTYFGGLFYDERTVQFFEESMASLSGQYFFIVIGVLTTVVLFFTGKPILRGAWVAVRTRSPNMDLLVAIAALSAYVYSTLSIVVGGPHIYYDVTVAIIVIVTVGSYYESSVKERATELLTDLTSLQVDEARRVGEAGTETVPVEALSSGDRVLVRDGERIPIDGEVLEGSAAVNEAVITGESIPERKRAGDRVVGGSTVTGGSLTIDVPEDPTSTLDRITNLVWDLQSSNHGIQGLADKLATIFVPTVLALAIVVTSVYLTTGSGISAAMLVGLTVLIVSCPCALGLATPLAVATSLESALERSIVVFDESVFERLRGADTVVFDKTGTLTTGDMSVLEFDAPADLLDLVGRLEGRSAHPVANGIASAFGPDRDETDATRNGVVPDGGSRSIDPTVVAEANVEDEPHGANDTDSGAAREEHTDGITSFESHANGVSGTVDGTTVMAGHPDLFDSRGWAVPEAILDRVDDVRDRGVLPVVVGREGTAEGLVVLGDDERDGWEETVTGLSAAGVEIVVLTGDDETATGRYSSHEAIDRVFAGVPPEGKSETVRRLAGRGTTVMVGDGTNDAPALAAADLGIALGSGTAMAVDAADVAIVDDDLRSVRTVFDLASASGSRVKQNIGWAFLYNGIAIPLAITGLLNPLFAAAAMATSSILVVTNSSRALLSRK